MVLEEFTHNGNSILVDTAENLKETSIEEWVFTLDDDTTVTKKVVVHD